MAYEEDIRALERLERARLLAVVAALGLLVLAIVFDLSWLDWPRALSWTAAAIVSLIESRVLKRMGRSPDGAYLRAALFLLVAILSVV